jgi:polyhydroxyalkanoic acid synthase PhaR subunit
MSEPTQAGGSPRPDPFELWREMYDANERAWAKALEQTTSRPEFAEASSKMLENLLSGQRMLRDSMRTYLEAANMPTREDIARVGELIVNLEEKVDQLADRLDAIEAALHAKPRDSKR